VKPDAHRALLERRFPDLGIESMETFGAGWDTVTYLLNGELVARFPSLDGAPANDLLAVSPMLGSARGPLPATD